MDDQSVLQQIFFGQNIFITPITGKGDVNRVYLVKNNNQKLIVRLNDVTETDRFTKEAWCLKKASSIGIPSPRIIDIGTKNNLAYMVLTFVPGKNGNQITENQANIWHTIGTYAKKIHSVSVTGFGENMTTPGNFFDTWQRYLTYNIDSLDDKDRLLSLKTITSKQSKLIKHKFISLRQRKFNLGLIHGDLSLQNVIVDKNKVTLIDWGTAEVNIVPHMEIIDIFQNQTPQDKPFFDNFLQGYGITWQDFQLLKPDIDTLTLLQAIDKLRWAIDRHPSVTKEYSQKVTSIVTSQSI